MYGWLYIHTSSICDHLLISSKLKSFWTKAPSSAVFTNNKLEESRVEARGKRFDER